ncbi:retropepsin-like aspartic protease family protein [Yoonia sp. 208BN28-4]|uniref:retropepsin-like aspartic protease family protein n=1 Tax=Yoonia sp. 208BN28-4 TaxID=3126505 RepID=UPI0030AC1CE6
MNGDQIANAAFLGLLGVAIAGSYLVANRDSLGKMAQQATIWGLIFVGVIAAIGLWSDVSRDVTGRQSVVNGTTIEVPRMADGHYYLTLDVNGVPVNFVVDTGATQVVLTQADAARVGLDPDNLAYLGQANTANGVTRTASVWLDDVALGPFTDNQIRASVNAGEMNGSLLGMSYLGLYDEIRIAGDRLILTR